MTIRTPAITTSPMPAEQIDPQQVSAVQATGANPLLTFFYAIIPQALPVIASYSLLLFESNIRYAFSAGRSVLIAPHRQVGVVVIFVTQFLKTRPRVTALELVAEPLIGTGMTTAAAHAHAQIALEFFGVKPALWVKAARLRPDRRGQAGRSGVAR
jgi:hypothetical protein